jgi:predicted dehydrogenase
LNSSSKIESCPVAVIGCGHWGQNLVRNFAGLGALAAICDPEPEPATTLSRDFDAPIRTWAEILGDPAIPAVAIAAPAVHHSYLANEALDAGKHVFVEKPLALDVDDATKVVAKAAKKNHILMVGHLMRYHPVFQKLYEMVRNGDLGKLQYVYSTRLNFGKVRREENILWSFAPHDISMILALMGEDPIEVTATGATYLQHDVADVTTTYLRFSEGRVAHILVSWLYPFKEQKLIVVGEKNMAVLDDGETWERKLLLYPHSIEMDAEVLRPNKAEAVPVIVEHSEPLRNECQHFLDCIATGDTPMTDGHEGIQVLKVLRAAEQSIAESKPITQDAGHT